MEKTGSTFLAEHSIGIIISFLCLIVLLYFGVSMYGIFLNNKDIAKNTEENLKVLGDKIIFLKKNEKSGSEILTLKRGMFVKSFDSVKILGGEFEVCKNSVSCLCFCERIYCESGIIQCNGFDFDVVVDESYETFKPTTQQLTAPEKVTASRTIFISGSKAYELFLFNDDGIKIRSKND
mgnify:CR=1 FL=1